MLSLTDATLSRVNEYLQWKSAFPPHLTRYVTAGRSVFGFRRLPEFNIPPQDAVVAARPAFVCRHCGAPMIVIEILERTAPIRAPPMRRGET